MAKKQDAGALLYLNERICPVCKKYFIAAPQHTYKNYKKTMLVCSYTCSLQSERDAQAKMKRKKGVKNND